jgi:hypothetical protein
MILEDARRERERVSMIRKRKRISLPLLAKFAVHKAFVSSETSSKWKLIQILSCYYFFEIRVQYGLDNLVSNYITIHD